MKFTHFATIAIAAFTAGTNAENNLRGPSGSINALPVEKMAHRRADDTFDDEDDMPGFYVLGGTTDKCWQNRWDTAILMSSYGSQIGECTLFERIGSRIVLAEDHGMCLTAGSGQKVNGQIPTPDLETPVAERENVGVYACADDGSNAPGTKARQEWNVNLSSDSSSFTMISDPGYAIEYNGSMGIRIMEEDGSEAKQRFRID